LRILKKKKKNLKINPGREFRRRLVKGTDGPSRRAPTLRVSKIRVFRLSEPCARSGLARRVRPITIAVLFTRWLQGQFGDTSLTIIFCETFFPSLCVNDRRTGYVVQSNRSIADGVSMQSYGERKRLLCRQRKRVPAKRF
jgi:hypothetical protein